MRARTPVPAPVFDGGALAIAAWAFSPLLQRHQGPAAATLLRGAGLTAAVALAIPSLGEGLPAATVPLTLLTAAITTLQANARRAAPHAVGTVVGIGLLLAATGIGVMQASAFPHPTRLAATLVATLVLSLLGLVLRGLLTRSAWKEWTPMPVGIVTASALASTYVAYRPVAADHVNNLPLYEWTLAAGIALLAFSRIRKVARAHETPESWSLDARRHAQDVRPSYDPRMTPLAAIFQRWLENGEGHEEYRAALAKAHGGAIPQHLAGALDAARDRGRTPRGRREAAGRRIAAHEALIASLTHPRRGQTDGDPQRPLRPNP